MKFAHKLTLALLVVLAVVLSLCNTVLIGQQFRQELHTAQETLSADWQRESRAMQRTLVTPGSGSLAARVGSYLQAITEQNSLACAAYSVDGTSLYYALPTAVPLSEVEALLAQDGEPRPPGIGLSHLMPVWLLFALHLLVLLLLQVFVQVFVVAVKNGLVDHFGRG